MRKLFLSGLLLALLLSAGCVHLAARPEEKPDFGAVWELGRLLGGISYRDWKYERQVFDCTNMSAYLYEYLTVRGYDCKIVVGAVYPWGFLTGQCHAWLIVRKDGQKFLVEPVEKRPASPADFRKYLFRFGFDSLEEARKFYRIFGQEGEWAY